METHYLELRAANRHSTANFVTISQELFNGKGVFEHAINYANTSESFKRTGKHLEIVEYNPKYIIVKITSETGLRMISKSLAGFSRELLRVDNTREEEGKRRLFEDCIYNHAVFRSKSVVGQEKISGLVEDLSDAAALKMCIDLFYGDTIKNKEQMNMKKKSIAQIKNLLINYKTYIEREDSI